MAAVLSKGLPCLQKLSNYTLCEYCANGGQGNYHVSGHLSISLLYHEQKESLRIKIVEAANLAAAKQGITSDPFVKMYLLPDLSRLSKKITMVQRRTTNPLFDQYFEYQVTKSQLKKKGLLLSVWDWDEFGRNLFLGECVIRLSKIDFQYETEGWYRLQEWIPKPMAESAGSISFSLKFSAENQGTLSVKVENAKISLLPPGSNNLFVRSLLLPEQDNKTLTKIIPNSLEPSWSETFKYEGITVDELAKCRVLELSLWNFDILDGHEFIGCVRLGPFGGKKTEISWMDASLYEALYWNKVLSTPDEWVYVNIPLHATIAQREMEITSDSSNESLNQSGGGNPRSSLSLLTSSEEEFSGNHMISGRLLTRVDYYKGFLVIHVLKARVHIKVRRTRYTNPFVKICLKRKGRVLRKWKSSVRYGTVTPYFDEIFEYAVKPSHLPSCILYFTVLHKERYKFNKLYGKIELKLSDPDVYGKARWHGLGVTIYEEDELLKEEEEFWEEVENLWEEEETLWEEEEETLWEKEEEKEYQEQEEEKVEQEEDEEECPGEEERGKKIYQEEDEGDEECP